MTKLDDSIKNIDYIYACLMDYRLIQESGCCNDCSKKNASMLQNLDSWLGIIVRFMKGRKKNDIS